MNGDDHEASESLGSGFTQSEADTLLEGDPETLIKEAAKKGIDFKGLNFPVIEMVEENFGISPDDTSAMTFVFWVAFFIEKMADELIVELLNKSGCNKNYAEIVVGNLTFYSKIASIEELFERRKDPVLSMMRLVQTLRNHVAHGRYTKLVYKNESLKGGVGQVLLIGDIKEAFKS